MHNNNINMQGTQSYSSNVKVLIQCKPYYKLEQIAKLKINTKDDSIAAKL